MGAESANAELLRVLLWCSGIIYVLLVSVASVSDFLSNLLPAFIERFAEATSRVINKLWIGLFPNSNKVREYLKKTFISYEEVLNDPPAFTELRHQFMRSIELNLSKGNSLKIFGCSGSGKTTLVHQICKRVYNESELFGAVVKKTPIYVSALDVANAEGLSPTQFLYSALATRFRTRKAKLANLAAKRLISSGQLLIIIDDIDHLYEGMASGLLDVIDRKSSNQFICVSRRFSASHQKLPSRFKEVQVPTWHEREAKKYLAARLGEEKFTRIHSQIKESGLYDVYQTPLQWIGFANAYFDHNIFEIIASKPGYNLVELMLEKFHGGARKCVGSLGKLALNLTQESRKSFSQEELDFSIYEVESLLQNNRLLKRSGGPLGEDDMLEFAHISYTKTLAGMYLGWYWNDVKELILNFPAQNLIWGDIYSTAERYIDPSHLTELKACFQKLEAGIV